MGPVTRFDAADGAPLAVGFNQDATCVALADGGGVRVWSLRGGGSCSRPTWAGFGVEEEGGGEEGTTTREMPSTPDAHPCSTSPASSKCCSRRPCWRTWAQVKS
jgi:hypothetical protein